MCTYIYILIVIHSTKLKTNSQLTLKPNYIIPSTPPSHIPGIPPLHVLWSAAGTASLEPLAPYGLPAHGGHATFPTHVARAARDSANGSPIMRTYREQNDFGMELFG